jgi:hypothetical protein
MKIEIKHRLTGSILFSIETDSMRLAVEAAIKQKADLRYANLRYADLRYADLSYANLRYADLRYADLSSANLRYANLSYANLSYANLSYANLRSADLSSANLRYADLSSANLSYANLSYAKNILSQSKYMQENFKKTKIGFIVYKTFNSRYPQNTSWTIEKKSIIEEVVNPDRTIDCACGVNVATLDRIKKEAAGDIWQCLIKWEWLAGVVVPYHTDGKIRAEKVQLIKIIKR